MKKLYIDSDVLLDVLMMRLEHYPESAQLLSLVDMKKVEGVTTPLVFANLYYLLRKHRSHQFALTTLTSLEGILGLIPVEPGALKSALSSPFLDFEDAIEYHAAIHAGVDHIITRNKKDFRHSRIPVQSPPEFLSLYLQSATLES